MEGDLVQVVGLGIFRVVRRGLLTNAYVGRVCDFYINIFEVMLREYGPMNGPASYQKSVQQFGALPQRTNFGIGQLLLYLDVSAQSGASWRSRCWSSSRCYLLRFVFSFRLLSCLCSGRCRDLPDCRMAASIRGSTAFCTRGDSQARQEVRRCV